MNKTKSLVLLTLLFGIQLITNAQSKLTDTEGNEYNTITIGSRTWMSENLRVTKYNDGEDIPLITDNAEWKSSTQPGYCWYSNNKDNAISNGYGALYNWYTVDTDKLCPIGWHVPTNNEWTFLAIYLNDNGYNYDGSVGISNEREKIAKSLAGTTSWNSDASEGTVGNTDYPEYRNKTGFTALAAGYRSAGFNGNGTYSYAGELGNWWSETGYTDKAAYSRHLYNSSSELKSTLTYYKSYGFSVRCIKDELPNYTVIFSNWNGDELKRESVKHGNSATAPSAPEKQGYVFVGWDTDFSNVTEHLTIKAQFDVASAIDNTEQNTITIYPNPISNGVVYIKTDALIEEVNIYNQVGKQVYTNIYTTNGIDVSSLPGGVYFINVNNVTNKLIIKK